MNREPVKSSYLKAVGYDPETKTLEVELKDGSVYSYSDVPADVYDELLATESVGSFVGANIRGKFKSKKKGE